MTPAMAALTRTRAHLRCLSFGLVLALALAGCHDSNQSTPTTPPVAAPAPPAPTATPPPSTAPTPEPPGSPNRAFELSGLPGSCIAVRYVGAASWAQVETYYTTFESKVPLARELHDVKAGGSFTRCFGKVCIQGDAEQVNVKPIGGVYFDRQGNPTTAELATASCGPGPTPTPSPTPTPCVPKGRVKVYGDTHVSGSYRYEVRLADGTVVWSGTLARGATASFSYPPDGRTLHLWLDTDPGAGKRWEHDASVQAVCPDVQAAWNERITFSCSCD